ncbi:recombinase RecT [Mesoplasma melaleucae]|uniref:Uncharacterized protein n=1 Tax=Mesoplasma melaleucae TaxID=81459 RepID=A0A2K8NVJ8_9MOLU|nr:recombinase RecT [Mesoplasma melaleucae]ATZ17797.1 hypothetical protein EMELA_v1c02240 [Mesoplasma melaleucae]
MSNIQEIKQFEIDINKLTSNKTIKLNKEAEIAIKNNITALKEMSIKGDNALNTILSSENKEITLLSIFNNSLCNLVLNKDFYLIKFKNKMVEIKNANAWKQLALKFGINKFKSINVLVVFNEDKYKFGIDEYGNQVLIEYEPDFTIDRNNYNNIIFAIGTINFENKIKKTRVLSKSELDKIKSSSPSGNSEYSPWNNFPIKMIEAKVIRDMVIRDIQFDNTKMYSFGYKLIDDEMVLSVKDEVLVEQYEEPLKQANIEQLEPIVINELLTLKQELQKAINNDINFKKIVIDYLKDNNFKISELNEEQIKHLLTLKDLNIELEELN